MSERPGNESPLLVIELLGAEFRSLGEPPSRGRRPLTRRTLLIALALVLVLAGAATAAILITRGAPLPAANSRDLQSQGVPLAATARLAGLDAPDPRAGEPPWDIRLSRTAAGETCTAVGQVLGSQFGIVGLDHVFRALPLGGVDACGVAAPEGPLLAGARVFVGADPSQARTVINGVAGPDVRSVTVVRARRPAATAARTGGQFHHGLPGLCRGSPAPDRARDARRPQSFDRAVAVLRLRSGGPDGPLRLAGQRRRRPRRGRLPG